MAIKLNTEQLDTLRRIEEALPQDRTRQQYKILAEGDSWFAYPKEYFFFGDASNVVTQLKELYPFLRIKNISSNGDEAVAMIVGSAKLDFLDRITREQFDLILFSGGGNDIVGRYDFEYFLQPQTNATNFRDYIVRERFERRLNQVRNAYTDLIELVVLACQLEIAKGESARISRIPPIVTHTYDIAIPSSQGAVFAGGLFELDEGRSWMQPYMEKYGINDLEIQQAIVKFMLEELAKILGEIEAKYGEYFKVVNTQGTLEPNDWLNEIHPTPQGFEKIARKIYQEGVDHFLNV